MSDVTSEPTAVGLEDVRLFDVVDLLVDEDNFRLEPSPNQPAALKAMLQRQGRKLVTLADEILDVGLSRGEFIWVAPDPRPEFAGKFVVCEGNRRVTAIKLMMSPVLAAGTKWFPDFQALGERYRARPVKTVRAVLYPSVDAARPDVYRRHTNAQDGRGLEDWDPFAQDRANRASGGRRTPSMVTMEHLTTSTIEGLAEGLGLRERTTNADRLLSTFSDEFASRYGIRIQTVPPYQLVLGDNPKQGEEILWEILRSADVSVDAIKSKGQRVAILHRVLSDYEVDAAEDQRKSADQDESTGDGGDSADDAGAGHGEHDADGADSGKKGGQGRTRDPLDRKTLASTAKSDRLPVTGVRLPKLYQECLTCVVADRPNSAAMLLRVFLELSCEAYLASFGVRTPGSSRDWSDYGINLETKVKKVLVSLDPEEKARDLVDARNGLAPDAHGQIHSLRSLHRAMHDRDHALDPTEIKRAWQRWNPLFRRIHEAISAR